MLLPQFVEPPERFELPTLSFEARYSSPLSYGGKLYGGSGETRTHTPIAGPSVFKTVAAMPIRLTLPLLVPRAGLEPATHDFSGHCSTRLELPGHKLLAPQVGIEPTYPLGRLWLTARPRTT